MSLLEKFLEEFHKGDLEIYEPLIECFKKYPETIAITGSSVYEHLKEKNIKGYSCLANDIDIFIVSSFKNEEIVNKVEKAFEQVAARQRSAKKNSTSPGSAVLANETEATTYTSTISNKIFPSIYNKKIKIGENITVNLIIKDFPNPSAQGIKIRETIMQNIGSVNPFKYEIKALISTFDLINSMFYVNIEKEITIRSDVVSRILSNFEFRFVQNSHFKGFLPQNIISRMIKDEKPLTDQFIECEETLLYVFPNIYIYSQTFDLDKLASIGVLDFANIGGVVKMNSSNRDIYNISIFNSLDSIIKNQKMFLERVYKYARRNNTILKYDSLNDVVCGAEKIYAKFINPIFSIFREHHDFIEQLEKIGKDYNKNLKKSLLLLNATDGEDLIDNRSITPIYAKSQKDYMLNRTSKTIEKNTVYLKCIEYLRNNVKGF